MSADPDETYTNTHRAFLQTFLSRSVLTFSEAQPILASLLTADEHRPTLPQDIRPADFESYIHTINAAISAYDYEIRGAYSQGYERSDSGGGEEAAAVNSKRKVYALVNRTSDPVTQLATGHKAEEVAFVKRLLDKMFEEFNTPTREVMAITSMEALKASRPAGGGGGRASDVNGAVHGGGGQTGGLTKSQAEGMVRSLLDEGWFVKVGGYLTLSPRGVMELRDWLRETYNEVGEDEEEEAVERVKSCAACREIITIGQRCTRRECKARLHEHCLVSYFRMQGGREQCGICKEKWTGDYFVGPKAAKTSRGSTSGGRRELVESDDDKEEAAPSRPRQRQSNGVGAAAKGKGRASHASTRRSRRAQEAEEESEEGEDEAPPVQARPNGITHNRNLLLDDDEPPPGSEMVNGTPVQGLNSDDDHA